MSKRKLTSTEKAKKRQSKREFKTIMIGGKQKKVRRESSFDITSADDITLHQQGLWHVIEEKKKPSEKPDTPDTNDSSYETPF